MIERIYSSQWNQLLTPGKVLVLYGARRVGKTTLVQEYLRQSNWKARTETGDDLRLARLLGSRSVERIKEFVAGYDLLFIDEAQKIPEIGTGLKILVDHVPELRIIATGSASFDLANKIGEPLTGRKRTRVLYPIAQLELLGEHANRYDLRVHVEERLIFGSYPELFALKTTNEKREYLLELTGSYLYKDILELERIKSADTLHRLVQLLAFQLGKDVSLSELGSQLRIDSKTVARYLDLLEKSFVVFSLSGFSRNLRKEISKSRRYFFVDNGIRNAVISAFNPLELRDDVGALWENFMQSERRKKNAYLSRIANSYFWRTYDQKEIDLIEEENQELKAFEFKYQQKSQKPPKDFTRAYPSALFQEVNRENFLDFVLGE